MGSIIVVGKLLYCVLQYLISDPVTAQDQLPATSTANTTTTFFLHL